MANEDSNDDLVERDGSHGCRACGAADAGNVLGGSSKKSYVYHPLPIIVPALIIQ
uniref:Uncharacterized protein n=1 Tax=Oryza sativa subsp. japonica TaxID=39947 RepID=Q6H4M4_ORYSJ|nr:hypothetical protein [Oryza sativa Japonica Group]